MLNSDYDIIRDITQIIFEKFDYKCANCLSEENLTIAHYVPRSLAGNNNTDNLIVLCFNCHRLQHDGKIEIAKIHNYFYFKRKKM